MSYSQPAASRSTTSVNKTKVAYRNHRPGCQDGRLRGQSSFLHGNSRLGCASEAQIQQQPGATSPPAAEDGAAAAEEPKKGKWWVPKWAGHRHPKPAPSSAAEEGTKPKGLKGLWEKLKALP